jgi:hypothetical protein
MVLFVWDIRFPALRFIRVIMSRNLHVVSNNYKGH